MTMNRLPWTLGTAVLLFLIATVFLTSGDGKDSPAIHAQEIDADFGDAPESDEQFFCGGLVTHYPSRLASSGPFHDDLSKVWLGRPRNTVTSEPDAHLPNCEDWVMLDFDRDDGCVILWLDPPSFTAGYVCGYSPLPNPPGPAVARWIPVQFGPPPRCPVEVALLPLVILRCEFAFWLLRVSVSEIPFAEPYYVNVVVDSYDNGPNGIYGDSMREWALKNAPVSEERFPSQEMATAPFTVFVVVDLQQGTWAALPFWTRFMVSSVFKDPAAGWDGSGPPFGGAGETEDWLVFGDPLFGGRRNEAADNLVRTALMELGILPPDHSGPTPTPTATPSPASTPTTTSTPTPTRTSTSSPTSTPTNTTTPTPTATSTGTPSHAPIPPTPTMAAQP